MNSRALSFALALLTTAAPALADRCPVCGQDPCTALRKPASAPIFVPSPPTPAADPLAGVYLSGLLQGAADFRNDAAKLLSRPPAALLNWIGRASASYDEYKNPKTFEQWGRALQTDAALAIVKSVYLKAASARFPSIGEALDTKELRDRIRDLHDLEGYANNADVPMRERLNQFFNLLDKAVSEALTSPPQSGLSTGLVYAMFEPAPQPQESARSLREKLWHAIVTTYHDAGLFDQVVDFHQIALERWGAVQDQNLRESIEALVADSKNVLAFPILTNPPALDGPVKQLSRNNAMFLNFRFPEAAARFELELTGGRNALYRIILHPDDQGRDLELFVNSIIVPAGLSLAQSRASWNALKLEFADSMIGVFVNGRKLGRFAASYQDSGGAYGLLTSLSVKLNGSGLYRFAFREVKK